MVKLVNMLADLHPWDALLACSFGKQSIVSSLRHCHGHPAFQSTTGMEVGLVECSLDILANGRKLASETNASGLFTAKW